MKNIPAFMLVGALFVALCSSIVACNESDIAEQPDPEQTIEFAEYSPGGVGEEFSGRWVNLPYEDDTASILLINSDKELQKYVEGKYPPVDFTTKTMVVAYGSHSGGGWGFDIKFRQVAAREYILTASTYAGAASAMFEWQVAVVVDKLPANSKITFEGILLMGDGTVIGTTRAAGLGSADYYWYNGEKIPLTRNEEFVNVVSRR